MVHPPLRFPPFQRWQDPQRDFLISTTLPHSQAQPSPSKVWASSWDATLEDEDVDVEEDLDFFFFLREEEAFVGEELEDFFEDPFFFLLLDSFLSPMVYGFRFPPLQRWHFPQRLCFAEIIFPQLHVQFASSSLSLSPVPLPLALFATENRLKCIRQNPSFLAWSSLLHPTTLHRGLPRSFVFRVVHISMPELAGTIVCGIDGTDGDGTCKVASPSNRSLLGELVFELFALIVEAATATELAGLNVDSLHFLHARQRCK